VAIGRWTVADRKVLIGNIAMVLVFTPSVQNLLGQ